MAAIPRVDCASILLGRCLAPLVLACGAGVASAQAHLEHSAPWLGRTLDLDVVGAPANQTVELLYSPSRTSIPTPLGTLELRRRALRRLGVRTSDGSGHATFHIAVPLDPALADQEAHFQAIVTDPAAPAGRTLMNASHLRLLGTRLYAHERSRYPDPIQGGLEIVDAVHGAVSARVDFGPVDDAELTNEEGKPVFSANFAVGAVMATSTRLVFFDPFFGTTRAEVPVAPSSRILWTDAAGARVYVLEKGSSAPPVQGGACASSISRLRPRRPISPCPRPPPGSGARATTAARLSSLPSIRRAAPPSCGVSRCRAWWSRTRSPSGLRSRASSTICGSHRARCS